MICRRIVSVLLAMVLCFACVATASAETCYTMLKEMFTNPEYDAMYIGRGISAESDDSSKNIFFWYDVDHDQIVLSGMNSAGRHEYTYFSGIDFGSGIARVALICGVYDTIVEDITPGYSLVVAILSGEDSSGWLTASNSSEAASLFQAIVDTLGK